MSPQANSIRTTKTKRILKRKAEERPSTRNDVSLIDLVLNVGLNIPISTRHYILLIGTISNEKPCE